MSFELFLLTLYLVVGVGIAWWVCGSDMYARDPVRVAAYAVVLVFIWGFLVPLVVIECLFSRGDNATDLPTDLEIDDDEQSQSH